MPSAESLPPVISQTSKVLILGSFPGRLSLHLGQYYAHPRNAFWIIAGQLFGANPELPYQSRIARLLESSVALWDVLQACDRFGSLDQNIRKEIPNDLPGLLHNHPNIRTLAFNGDKAFQMFHRWTLPGLPKVRQTSLTLIPLPSTSPANTRFSLIQKLERWRRLQDCLVD